MQRFLFTKAGLQMYALFLYIKCMVFYLPYFEYKEYINASINKAWLEHFNPCTQTFDKYVICM